MCHQPTFHNPNSGEYLNDRTAAYFSDKGILHQKTTAYTPEQNGVAERLNRTIVEKVRAMLQEAGLPPYLWAEAANTACYLRNRSPAAGIEKTPFELFWGRKPSVGHLRTFGCTAFVQIPKDNRTKLQPTSEKGRLVGYDNESKAYRVLVRGTIKISRDVVFDERLPKALSSGQSSGKAPMPKPAVTPVASDNSDNDSDGEDNRRRQSDHSMPEASFFFREERLQARGCLPEERANQNTSSRQGTPAT